MPQARDAAETLHRLVPDPALPAERAAHALACPATGAPCPALSAVFGSLAPESEPLKTWLLSLAPCSHCRVAVEQGCAGLRHRRLGQRERDILSEAAATDVLVLTAPGMSRSMSASRRRAALALGGAGLVSASAVSDPGGGPARSAVSLTALGRYVMGAYGRYIASGQAVRWTRPLKSVALPGQDPTLLAGETLARLQSALRDTLGDLKGVLVAAITGRIKDPDRLDTVARHLEEKAILLRSALQSAPPAAGR